MLAQSPVLEGFEVILGSFWIPDGAPEATFDGKKEFAGVVRMGRIGKNIGGGPLKLKRPEARKQTAEVGTGHAQRLESAMADNESGTLACRYRCFYNDSGVRDCRYRGFQYDF